MKSKGNGAGRSIGEVVREGREKAGLSQKALATRSGVSQQAISALEAGKVTGLRAGTMTRLGKALFARGDVLFAMQGSKERVPVVMEPPANVVTIRFHDLLKDFPPEAQLALVDVLHSVVRFARLVMPRKIVGSPRWPEFHRPVRRVYKRRKRSSTPTETE